MSYAYFAYMMEYHIFNVTWARSVFLIAGLLIRLH